MHYLFLPKASWLLTQSPANTATMSEGMVIAAVCCLNLGKQDLQPHDMKTVSSSEPVLYAWEMNLVWFKRHNIKVGDKVTLPTSN